MIKNYQSFLESNFPHRFQDKGYTCGPTAVKMVLDWLGYADVSVDYLELISKTDPIIGCTDRSMDLMLNQLGLRYKRYVSNKEENWNAFEDAIIEGDPIILRTLTKGIKHWIVVYGKENENYKVADPWLGDIKYTKNEIESIWAPRDYDCFIVTGNPIPKLLPIDWDKSIELAKKCFPSESSWIESYLNETTDKSISFCIKIGSVVVGAYFLSPRNLEGEIGNGLEGVCLCIDEHYRSRGWSKLMISKAESLGYDYMWGQHLKTLNNIGNWSKRREKILDADEVWISIRNLKN